MTGFFCSTPIYKYNGVTFEFGYNGPWRLRKDGEPYNRVGHKFYDIFYEWSALPEKEKESYRIGGGCERF